LCLSGRSAFLAGAAVRSRARNKARAPSSEKATATCTARFHPDNSPAIPPAAPDGTFSRDGFTYDHERDVYRCPGGTALPTTGTLVNSGATMLDSALQRDCAGCAFKSRCCPNTPARKIPRSIHEVHATWPGREPGRGKGSNVISPNDPCSAWTAKANKRVQFGYGLNYRNHPAKTAGVLIA
jgi:hypothetical protein